MTFNPRSLFVLGALLLLTGCVEPTRAIPDAGVDSGYAMAPALTTLGHPGDLHPVEPGDPMTDIPDIRQHRAARETAKLDAEATDKIKQGAEEAKEIIGSAMDAMTNPAFVAFIKHAEAVFPQHSVIKAPWFQSNISSLIGVYINEIPPEAIKTLFGLMIDWMYGSYVQQNGGPPDYPPVLCDACRAGEHGPKGT